MLACLHYHSLNGRLALYESFSSRKKEAAFLCCGILHSSWTDGFRGRFTQTRKMEVKCELADKINAAKGKVT